MGLGLARAVMRGLVAVVAGLLALLLLASPSSAVPAAPNLSESPHLNSGHPDLALSPAPMLECGSPEPGLVMTGHAAVDHWSDSAPACPDAATPCTATTYGFDTILARVAGGTTTIVARAEDPSGRRLLPGGGGVAATHQHGSQSTRLAKRQCRYEQDRRPWRSPNMPRSGMTQRGVSIDAAEAALAQKPFQYFHQNVWKTGYYDPTSQVFLGSMNGRVTTVIGRASTNYIDNLKAAVP